MAKTPRLLPTNPRLFRARVLRTQRVTPSMQRVTVTGDDLHEFGYLGFDHWFRLFVRRPDQDAFRMPDLDGKKWWPTFLGIPEDIRPHCANYTVAAYRLLADGTAELDIDFVVHLDHRGQLEGRAAIWACSARPGEELAMLDQGCIFDVPAGTSEVIVAAEETGLPGIVGIAASLPRDTVGRIIQEVPTAADIRDLDAPTGLQVTWIVRQPGAVPGSGALAELQRHVPSDDRGYAFVVGESKLATEGRRHLHRAGLPKSRITFSGFWKHETKVSVPA
ncbi:NADPH-dependent ferric siderophore reductase [Curtobacterium sp. MCBA15_007]|uniref:siderophore-interacting protein n=1 Tax=Curtobacterium TaxID=2034 RepID=UPI0008DD75CC|nr:MULTISPECIES: siderophore-interacting protein [Curtobacterium]MCS6578713.1 siderophore-interacting protein [Curtobacterium flaccumfaciens]MCU0113556.1 siderophore-interacting protein [Curtobacterium flaccumfaciens]OII02257.1 NADPH-dependent ferric siderophore reductase [Curtobacterium sp. MCBA15_007]